MSPLKNPHDANSCVTFSDSFSLSIAAFTSKREVDFTLPAGQDGLTSLQNEYVESQVSINLSKVVNIRQVHGNQIVVLTDELVFKYDSLVEADGLMTNLPNVPLMIRTADCLPIFICDERQGCIALLHAGWRGTKQAIVSNAIKLMQYKYSSNPEDIKVVFGPAIRSCCYEVDENFLDYFPFNTKTIGSKHYFDLVGENQKQLIGLGVLERNIENFALCTCCSNDWFSYRREGNKAGRMISVMMINKRNS